MKILFVITILLSNFLFANYNYKDKNSGKIDMHGGKKDNLINQKNSISNINQIGVIKPIAPIKPKKPQNLIKEEMKQNKILTGKKDKKENKK